MLPRTRKRGQVAAAHDDSAVLRAFGLWEFAQLHLHLGPDDLDLAAAYDSSSDLIAVFVGGDAVLASRADLAAALSLPLGPAASPAADAAMLSSAEAIATLRRLLCDRLLVGGGWDGGGVPDEAVAALRLVEAGKAHAVDWGGLVWTVVARAAAMGKPRRYMPHLLRLVEFQRPELLRDIRGRLAPRKRRKGAVLLQCQVSDGKPVGCKEAEVDDEEEEGNKAQCLVTGAEVACLASGVSKNVGCEVNLVPNTKERLVLGESKQVSDFYGPADVMLVDRKKAMENKGNAGFILQKCLSSDLVVVDCGTTGGEGLGADGGNANVRSCSTDDSSFLSLLRMMDEQDDSCSIHKMIVGSELRPASNQPQIIEIDNANDDGNIKENGPSGIRSGGCYLMPYAMEQHRTREGIRNDQTLLPFHAFVEQALSFVPNMEMIFLEKERACMDTQMTVQRMKDMAMEKDCIIADIKKDIVEELQVRHIMSCRLEQDMKTMEQTIQQYKSLLQKSYAAFWEYRSLFGEGGESSSGVLGIAGGQNCKSKGEELLIQFHQMINGSLEPWLSKYLGCAEQITGIATNRADLNDEVQRLKDSI